MKQTNYQKYRGKCKEYCEKAIENDQTLQLARGYYYCPFWGKQPHWWCKRQDGTIYDPTVDQFPKPHIGEYEEFNGVIYCENCGKEMTEEEAHINGNYACCSYSCSMKLVGL